MKKKSFFFHYNKPASRSAGMVKLSLHYDKKCHIVDNVICNIATEGRLRKMQPHFVMAGKCNKVQIDNGIAIIT